MILMRWPELGCQVRVKLLDDINPELCDILLARLPLTSIQSHAVVCGEQMYFPFAAPAVPAAAYFENMASQPAGRMNIEPKFHYLSVNYGPNHEAVPALAVAQVLEEDLGMLRTVGRLVWDNLLFSTEYLHVVLDRLKEGA